MILDNMTVEGVNKAVIYSDPPSIKTEVVELPIPKPGPGEVLVRLYVDSRPLSSKKLIYYSHQGSFPVCATQIMDFVQMASKRCRFQPPRVSETLFPPQTLFHT